MNEVALTSLLSYMAGLDPVAMKELAFNYVEINEDLAELLDDKVRWIDEQPHISPLGIINFALERLDSDFAVAATVCSDDEEEFVNEDDELQGFEVYRSEK